MVTTSDNIGVAHVHMSITDEQGAYLESGYAVDTSGNGDWSYAAKAAVPAGKTVTIKAIATDRPGGTAVSTNTKAF